MTESAPPLATRRSEFLLRRVHSLTGIIFGGYLVVHLIVNATLAQAGDVYQVQVQKIHDLPLLWALEWGFIYLPIIFHTIYGVWIIATGRPNALQYGYAKNWFYLLQRISAVIIVLFLVFHVLSLKYGTFNWMSPDLQFRVDAAAHSMHLHMTAFWWVAWVIYPLGIIASVYHTANGLWTAGITWGLTVSAGAQKRWGAACGVIFILLLVLGFVALIASLNPELATPPDPDAPVIEVPSVVP
jgi:succinate dehydrogenase / fumarate reductase, cytochrome b subunit